MIFYHRNAKYGWFSHMMISNLWDYVFSWVMSWRDLNGLLFLDQNWICLASKYLKLEVSKPCPQNSTAEQNLWPILPIQFIILVFNWWMWQNDPFVENLSDLGEKNATVRQNRTQCNLWVPDTTKPLPEPNDSKLPTSIPVQFHRKFARYADKNIKVYNYFHTSAR